MQHGVLARKKIKEGGGGGLEIKSKFVFFSDHINESLPLKKGGERRIRVWCIL